MIAKNIIREMVIINQTIRGNNNGIFKRYLALYERAEKVLVSACHHHIAAVRRAHCI